MAKIQSDQPLLPSVLDRLIDDEPDVTRDPPRSRYQILSKLKQSVRDDLENLLNTRRRIRPAPTEFADLDPSMVSYGVPDSTGAGFGSPEGRERFRAELEAVIIRWEPRFTNVRVVLIDPAEELERTVHFRIEALLLADPAPEPVVFDSALEPTTGNIEVRGVNG
jgi:type VI secretion system protein ImpF